MVQVKAALLCNSVCIHNIPTCYSSSCHPVKVIDSCLKFDQGNTVYINPSMNFLINETVCGIEIKAADFDDHDGRWKCHLADTDVNAQIKSEAYTEINVMTFLLTHIK